MRTSLYICALCIAQTFSCHTPTTTIEKRIQHLITEYNDRLRVTDFEVMKESEFEGKDGAYHHVYGMLTLKATKTYCAEEHSESTVDDWFIPVHLSEDYINGHIPESINVVPKGFTAEIPFAFSYRQGSPVHEAGELEGLDDDEYVDKVTISESLKNISGKTLVKQAIEKIESGRAPKPTKKKEEKKDTGYLSEVRANIINQNEYLSVLDFIVSEESQVVDDYSGRYVNVRGRVKIEAKHAYCRLGGVLGDEELFTRSVGAELQSSFLLPYSTLYVPKGCTMDIPIHFIYRPDNFKGERVTTLRYDHGGGESHYSIEPQKIIGQDAVRRAIESTLQ